MYFTFIIYLAIMTYHQLLYFTQAIAVYDIIMLSTFIQHTLAYSKRLLITLLEAENKTYTILKQIAFL